MEYYLPEIKRVCKGITESNTMEETYSTLNKHKVTSSLEYINQLALINYLDSIVKSFKSKSISNKLKNKNELELMYSKLKRGKHTVTLRLYGNEFIALSDIGSVILRKDLKGKSYGEMTLDFLELKSFNTDYLYERGKDLYILHNYELIKDIDFFSFIKLSKFKLNKILGLGMEA